MVLGPGTPFGPYEIRAAIGAGGMGEVYRAFDARLQRDVAIKVLPHGVAADPDRLARFEREARMLAALNHPSIAQIHGLEEHSGVRALIMEFVDGTTLAECIASGPLELQAALPIAGQIVDALASAHDRGIVHRDLKPANIKLRPDGSVKVLDFGLAKAVEAADQRHDATRSPTITSPAALTAHGTILGTAAYMSPEQARGAATDKRADVWAFGCVFFEILTGRRSFGGDTVADALAQVLTSDPDWNRLPAATPPSIRRLLRRCLAKDPRQRLQDIGDARLEIADAQAGDEGASAPSSSWNARWIWAAAASALIAGAALGAFVASTLRREPAAAEVRVDITLPAGSEAGSFALSPDGSSLVFTAPDAGRRRLWLRSLTSGAVKVLRDTDGAAAPFWAPGGAAIGFFADDGKMKRIDLDSGVVRTVASTPLPWGGSWGADDTILVVPYTGPIQRVSASGGKTEPVTTVSPGQAFHAIPSFLPDGRHFIYYVAGSPAMRGVYLASLDRPAGRRLVDADGMAAGFARGNLLFLRGTTLLAQPLDVASEEVTGAAFPIADAVAVQPFQGGAFSASPSGQIAYYAGAAAQQRQFVWFDRQGRELRKIGEPDSGNPLSPSLSRDGRRLAMHRTIDGNVDIWVLDVDRGVHTRVTADPANEIHPIWSPDSRRLRFMSNRTGSYQVYETSEVGPGNEKQLSDVGSVYGMPEDWSSDGGTLLMLQANANGSAGIWGAQVRDGQPAFPVVQAAGSDSRDPQFSPDAKWIAYSSNESGRVEVYVQRFPGPAAKTVVSLEGGAQPRWRADGKELYFIALDQRLMAASVSLPASGDAPQVSRPSPLFTTHLGGAVQSFSRPQYFAAPDGQSFLINAILEAPTTPITLVLNWSAALARRTN